MLSYANPMNPETNEAMIPCFCCVGNFGKIKSI